ncbi:DUF4129 domain-containing protein [Mycobacterium sp. IDR2000157661]|uniref:DUF4129 domain-containing protein n=1 Tax=Mycobacterium sp. IDR2000157661 TaxID=2867005 RepID=UPI001EEE8A1C|nr:DUF4129 domain-containing protein [Mycobacterium sp. IDR2000157661]ULE35014.1 DUF4129 domain-containing protein [Mycobacterium sp. IDR2000157661]
MPTIDIDSDTAYDAAQRELSKPIYPKPSLTERLLDWLNDLLFRLLAEGASVPGGWLTITVLLILLVTALVVAVRIARRTMRTSRGRDQSLFGGHDLSAAEHRAAAEHSAAEGDWAAAIRHRLRAVARQLEESGILDAVPGRTATELARDTGRALPDLHDELEVAAIAFNDVTYGDRPGTEAGYRMVEDLDRHLGAKRRAAAASAPPGPPTQGWAEVR